MAIQYSFVSLLDVIGYKNKIQADRDSNTEDFKKKLTDSLSILTDINEGEISYQAISDTIILSSTDKSSFTTFLLTNAAIHRSFLKNGLFVRGGIAFAHHFKSANLTYSHALPVSYEIEQRQAVYPRIVIDKNIIEMTRSEGKLAAEADGIIKDGLICFQNGVYFVNTIQGHLEDCYAHGRSMYEEDKSFLSGKEHELAKHRWFQDFMIAISTDNLMPYIEPLSIFSGLEHNADKAKDSEHRIPAEE